MATAPHEINTYGHTLSLHAALPIVMAEASHGSEGDSDEPGGRAARAGSGQVLAEVRVRPGSEMAGRTLEEVACRHKHQCIVLGIERRSRMLRERITRMPLKDGDVQIGRAHV